MENIVEAKNLSKQYHNCTALSQVNLTVKRGEIYGLVGANGAGKTTFLKLLAGHIFPTGGELTLFGAHEQRAQEKQRKRTGVIIETPGFVPNLTIAQNMEYYRLQKGIPGNKVIEDTLKAVGLWEMREKEGKTLSLGMKQRLGLAIALMGEPELLLLDEPINGLDPGGIIEMRNLLKKLNLEKNMTIIISSHILSELEQLATVYGFLDKGRIKEQLSAKELHEKCGDYLEIAVTDAAGYAVLLEKKLQHSNYLVLADNVVRIYDLEHDVEGYSALAGENGMGIRSMNLKQNSLEEYYMHIIKGEQDNA